MGTRLSSQPLPLSPFAVTLNNTLSLITATITLRNKLVFFERGMRRGKRRPSYASGMPFSLQQLHLFGDRQTPGQFSTQFSTLCISFSLFSLSLTPLLLLCSFPSVPFENTGTLGNIQQFRVNIYLKYNTYHNHLCHCH